MDPIPYVPGALYNRVEEIHERLGGQRQGGISTPADSPFVMIFTGEAGLKSGYHDFWDGDVFHYYGAGQKGDMKDTSGNRALKNHVVDGKRLLVFQMMGKSKPCRYWGEFVCLGTYEKPEVDSLKQIRSAIVFRLVPASDLGDFLGTGIRDEAEIYKAEPISLESTQAEKLTAVRTKQTLFRRQLIGIEKECRLTKIRDLRFLRASHIKPWAACDTGDERIDGNNGLLLCPQADLLFDAGWISFENDGRLLRSSLLPSVVASKIGLNLKANRSCGKFNDKQLPYLNFHRESVFDRINSDPRPIVDKLLGGKTG